MELILISDSKLKIALTGADMERYSLDAGSLDYDCTETRAALWRLLDEAKHQTGFDAASEKLLVQIYAAAGGGCEMYITKLRKSRDESECGGDVLFEGTRDGAERDRCVYHTASLDDMIGICAVLRRFDTGDDSSVYADEGGGYYIVFGADHTRRRGTGVPLSAYLEEYGVPCPDRTVYYIEEHCRVVCKESAAARLSALA